MASVSFGSSNTDRKAWASASVLTASGSMLYAALLRPMARARSRVSEIGPGTSTIALRRAAASCMVLVPSPRTMSAARIRASAPACGITPSTRTQSGKAPGNPSVSLSSWAFLTARKWSFSVGQAARRSISAAPYKPRSTRLPNSRPKGKLRTE